MAKNKKSSKSKFQSKEIQKQYAKQTHRIREAIRRAEKAGFEVSPNIIPPSPKKVTAATIRKLSKITPEAIKSKSRFVDFSTGEILTGNEGIALRKAEAAEKRRASVKRRKRPSAEKTKSESVPTPSVSKEEPPQFSAIVFSNFKVHISYFNPAAQALCLRFLDTLIASLGPDKAAEVLETGKNNGNWLEPKVAYNLDLLSEALADMLNYTEATPEERAAVLDELEDEIDIDAELYM